MLVIDCELKGAYFSLPDQESSIHASPPAEKWEGKLLCAHDVFMEYSRCVSAARPALSFLWPLVESYLEIHNTPVLKKSLSKNIIHVRIIKDWLIYNRNMGGRVWGGFKVRRSLIPGDRLSFLNQVRLIISHAPEYTYRETDCAMSVVFITKWITGCVLSGLS